MCWTKIAPFSLRHRNNKRTFCFRNLKLHLAQLVVRPSKPLPLPFLPVWSSSLQIYRAGDEIFLKICDSSNNFNNATLPTCVMTYQIYSNLTMKPPRSTKNIPQWREKTQQKPRWGFPLLWGWMGKVAVMESGCEAWTTWELPFHISFGY